MTERFLSERFDACRALYTVAQVRAIERAAIGECAIPGYELMTRAAQAAWRAARSRWPASARIAVLCGTGNNAGDGFLFAREAASAGVEVTVFMLGDSARLVGDAKLAFAAMSALDVAVRPATQFDATDYDLLVDALFGIGLSRPLDAAAARVVQLANQSTAKRLALDVPSGLVADTGRAAGDVFAADMTVSFVALKQGLFTADARACCGDVLVDDLSIPRAAFAGIDVCGWRVDFDALLGSGSRPLVRPLAARDARAHKGRFGHVLVVGGERGFGGAARLCGEAAARVGAGLVSVATRAEHVCALLAARPELMVHAVQTPADLAPLAEAASVLAVGPGLGRGEWGVGLCKAICASDKAQVLDADALNIIAGQAAESAALVPSSKVPRVLTPHPGEAARLLGISTDAVEADRFAALSRLVARWQCVIVLKGAGTLVGGPNSAVYVIEGGNPGMASGGMGDVLTGVIAALIAQGLPALPAAVFGAAVHARAGDEAATAGGERGLLAADLFPALRHLVDRL